MLCNEPYSPSYWFMSKEGNYLLSNTLILLLKSLNQLSIKFISQSHLANLKKIFELKNVDSENEFHFYFNNLRFVRAPIRK